MPNTTATIDVTVTPGGPSITQGLNFAFTAGAGTPSGVVSSDGSLNLSKQYPSGSPVTLVFNMKTASVSFSTPPSVGTFPVSFYGQNGAKNACWIALQGQNPGVYNGTEFTFPPNAMGPNNSSLTFTDANGDGLTYVYALWVWIALTASSGQAVEDDPHIINRGTNP
jgi:hypothetical protein